MVIYWSYTKMHGQQNIKKNSLLYCINSLFFITNVYFNFPSHNIHNVSECLLTFYNPCFSSCDIQTRRLVTTGALLSIDSLTQRWSQLPPFRRFLLSRLPNIQEHWVCAKSVCQAVGGSLGLSHHHWVDTFVVRSILCASANFTAPFLV